MKVGILLPRILRVITGLLLLPACAGVTLGLVTLLRELATGSWLTSSSTLWFAGGFFAWLLLWFMLPQPVQAYVISHEMTHALWGMMFGARIRNIQVSARGGSVQVSRNNMLITLAPYFFPFYTAIVILLSVALQFFLKQLPLPGLWQFLVGLTWSFHLCFTLQSLFIRQPDILEYGRILSWALIYLFNVVGFCCWLVWNGGLEIAHLGNLLGSNLVAVYGLLLKPLKLLR